MSATLGPIGQLSHLIATIAFLLFGLSLALRRKSTIFIFSVAFACIITAAWAFTYVIAAYFQHTHFAWISAFETLRQVGWVSALLILQRVSLGLSNRPRHGFLIACTLAFIVTLQFALDLTFQFGTSTAPLGEQHPAALLFVACRLVMAIFGLVLLHNLYVNSGNDGGIGFRLFAVGVGLFCAYDLNLYTLYFLTGVINPNLLALRGAINTLSLPLLYLALRQETGPQFYLSHRAAFHTVSFSMIGLYLIAMSLLSYILKITGGNWGHFLQILFLAIATIAGALVVLSPRFRAVLRVRIAQNFYRYRYDYRLEWLQFITKIDANGPDHLSGTAQIPFRQRLVDAIGGVLDCRGGALLERNDDKQFLLSARWHWPDLPEIELPDIEPMLLYLQETGRIIDFEQLRHDALLSETDPSASHGDFQLPDWARNIPNLWLAVPLSHRNELIGVVLLRDSLAPRTLNWEDLDLLRTLGQQSASYLAEAASLSKLEEARTFDEFNRRFAFVMHDVKNVVSQLALVARNAEIHADKPEFRADMIATLNSSVAKMTDLLTLMSHESNAPAKGSDRTTQDSLTNLSEVLDLVATILRRQHTALKCRKPDQAIWVAGAPLRLEAMLTHLIQNAIDASLPDAPILVSLDRIGSNAVLRIVDNGQGMSPSFIKDELFKPFRSTKEGGFGIGAFEAREIIRASGGRLDVESQPGAGTCFTITLPIQIPADNKGS